MGGMRAIVSPSFSGKTSPDGIYSSFNAKVKESSSESKSESLGSFPAKTVLESKECEDSK